MTSDDARQDQSCTDRPFRVGLTDDNIYERIMNCPSSRALLETTAGIEIERCPVDVDPLEAQVLNRFDAIAAGGSYVSHDSVKGADRCTLIVRYGAGYDRVDLDACTEAGIILATTPLGVRRPVAAGALTLILAVSMQLFRKSKLVATRQWDRVMDPDHIGVGLTRKTLGFVGFGSIGKELHHLIRPFQMRHLIYDPYVDKKLIESLGAEQTDLNTLLVESDFVVVVCQLTEETRHLLSTEQFAMMKRSAYVVNVARGAIIDQKALTRALAEGVVAGAGLDALDPEPTELDDPLLEKDNVILTPHGLAYTDEMIRLCSEGCVNAALAVRQGRHPDSVINRAVLGTAQLEAKLAAYRRWCVD